MQSRDERSCSFACLRDHFIAGRLEMPLASRTVFRLFSCTLVIFWVFTVEVRARSSFSSSSSGTLETLSTAISRKEERIALILYGLPRQTHLTFRSIQSKIYDVLRRESVDFDVILHHVLYLKPYSNSRNNEHQAKINNSEWRLLQPDIQLSSEHDYFLESHKDLIDEILTYGDPHHNDGNSTRNELEALHSLKLATLVTKSSERNYTGMVILRPDLLYHDEINVTLLRWAMYNGAIVTPGWQTYGALNDRFSFGALEPMLDMGLRFDKILEFCRTTGRPWLAEDFVHWLIYKVPKSNLRARQHDHAPIHCHTTLTATRIRTHGPIKEDFAMNSGGFLECY